MRLIDSTTAEAYLRDTARVRRGERVRVRELTGGVSNMVLLVELPDRPDALVLKQARAQLRTRQEWFSRVERIWREADVLTICTELLARDAQQQAALSTGLAKPADNDPRPLPARTPAILFQDRENYVLAITAAPRPNTVWKQELLAGRIDPRIARACGRLLGTLHAESWLDEPIHSRIGDRTLFDELRVDPYYRALADCQPAARAGVERAIASLDAHPRSLVHADFSPKNLLVFSGGLLMVDFETGHFGDPAFDLGFFLTHLVLKACLKMPHHQPYLELTQQFQAAYDERLSVRLTADELSDLWARGIQHFALCAWARLDGKSPVEYLTDERLRDRIRRLSNQVLADRPPTWPAVVSLAAQVFATP